MISSLSIENFALIEKLAIDFSGGFSIITGETGAGKSILLGALGLAMGKRADLSTLKNKNEKCIIEATFKIGSYQLQHFFEKTDLDYEEETIIRREILPSGKSRAFVNDSPVNLQQLQELSDYLIDIHSQHETRELSEGDFQFRIIDSIAGNSELLSSFQKHFLDYKKYKKDLGLRKSQLNEAINEQDYNLFLLEELLSAQLRDGEQEELEDVANRLNNVEFIKENLDKALAFANEERFGILLNLKEFKGALQKIAGLSDQYGLLLQRTESSLIEFADIVGELESVTETVMGNPEDLQRASEKLQVIYNLQKKHQVSTVAELLEIQNDLDNKALSVSELENDISKTEKQIAGIEVILEKSASEIHDKRQEAIPQLSDQLGKILQQLGMPNVRFDIKISTGNHFYDNGTDELQFLFSANKGSDFGVLKKVASGGEMSRIMLAVKSILAKYSKLPTIIFDEIDTGVSGEIANQMGDIMKDMSKSMQVLSITHLPQIAAKGTHHFKVYKSVTGDQTQSELKKLTSEERVVEIAQMLSGSVVSDSAINHAKALLN